VSSKAAKIAENAARTKLVQIQEMYCCTVGSIVCSLSRLTNKDVDYTLDIFKKLKDDKELHNNVHNIKEMIDYIISHYYDDFIDYNCLYLLFDDTLKCSPTVVPFIDGSLHSFRFDDLPSKILSDALMHNEDDHITIEEIYNNDEGC
jgi:hypothetical protein